MNKRLKQLVLAATCMMVAEASPLLAETDAFAAAVPTVQSNSAEVNTNIIQEAVAQINNGTEGVSDYKALEINTVTSDNLASIRYVIKAARTSNSANLTKDQIKETVAKAITDINNAKTNINLGQATLDEYKLLQIEDVNDTNLPDVNSLMKGNRISTINKLKRDVKQIVASINNVNNGNAVLDDYYNLDIESVNSEYIAIINNNILNSKNGSYMNVAAIQKVVDKVNSDMDTVLSKIYKGQASLDDYKFICKYDVNDINIKDVNEWMGNQIHTDYNKVLGEINTVVTIYRNINDGSASIDEYYQIGINNVNESNVNIVKAEISERRAEKGSDITKEEIITSVNEAVNVNDLFTKINSGSAVVNDYDTAGISGVKDSNLVDVNEELKGKDYKTIKQIQGNIDPLINALENINSGKDTINDYKVLKIETVTDANIQYIRNYVQAEKANAEMNIGKAKIKECVDNGIKCLQAIQDCNAGQATKDEYSFLGIDVVTEGNVKYTNPIVKDKNIKDVSQLKKYVESNMKVINSLEQIGLGSATVVDYKNIGITTVTDSNLKYVNTDVSKAGLVTVKDVTNLVKTNAKIYAVFVRINAGTAALTDYTLIKVEGVTSDNLKYVNIELKDMEYDTAEKVQNEVNAYSKINEALIKIYAGDGTVDDYNVIKVEGVNDTNLMYVNYDIKGKAFIGLDKLVEQLTTLVKTEDCYIDINNGKGALDEYQFLNITGVDEDNLAYVNREVIDDVDIYKKNLQVVVTNALKVQASVTAINEGNEKIVNNLINEYKSFGMNVSKNWLDALQKAVVIAKLEKGDYLNKREILALRAQMMSTANPDASFITNQIIDRIGDNKDITPEEAKAIVDKVISDRYDAINRIAEGKGTVEDYAFIGQTDVNDDNLQCVNSDIALKNTVKVPDVTKFVNSSLVNPVKWGIAVYNINMLQDTVNASGIISDYAVLGVNISAVKWQNDLRDAVNIARSIKEDYLTRDEILAIRVDMMSTANPDSVFVKNQMLDRLGDFSEMSGEEVQKVVDSVKQDRYDAINRIAAGNGSVEDFAFIGQTDVNDDNLKYINTDIVENSTVKVPDVTKFVNSSLVNPVKWGIAVYNINMLQDTVNASGIITDYAVLGASISGAKWQNDLRDAIRIARTIKGTDLTRNEILAIRVDMMTTAHPDSVYVKNQILDRLGDFSEMSGEEVQKVVDSVKQDRYDAINRIAEGNGSVEDFAFIGQTDVNDDNLKYINTDIVENNTVKVSNVEDFVNSSLVNPVKWGIAVYNINMLQDTVNASGIITDYAVLGANISGAKWQNDLRDAIRIARAIKGTDLTRNEILAIRVDMMTTTHPDSVFIKNQILDRLGDFSEMSGEEVQKVVDSVKQDRYDAINRIAAGNGSVEDFAYLGHDEVTAENLKYINTDIQLKNTVSVSDVENFKNSDLTTAIKCGLAIWNINTGNDTVSSGLVTDYAVLGVTIGAATWQQPLRDAINIAKTIKGTDLTRDEILAVVASMTSKDNPDARFITQQIVDQRGDNTNLSSEEMQTIVDNVKAKRYETINKIAAGDGTIEDFAFIGRTDITDEILACTNADIKSNNTVVITEVESFKNSDITNAINCGVAIYKINTGTETVANGLITQYSTLGMRVLSGYLKALRQAVKDEVAKKGSYLTREEIETIKNKIVK